VRFNSDSSAYAACFDNWNSFDPRADRPTFNGKSYPGSIAAYTCLILLQD
jgi:hypothetical protein